MNDRLRRRTGPLTDELRRTDGGFGLGQLPLAQVPDATTRMICGYCSTGCALDVHLRDGRSVGLSPAPDYPVNLGMACPKGWEALTPMDAPDRLTRPLVRNGRGKLVPTDWETAVTVMVDGFKAIQSQHGRDSVAFLSTGQIPTEEMALLGALTKFGMGLRHGDGNTRQCMATAVVAYKQAFGFDAPPYTYADFERSDVVVLVGSNLAVAHPIMWERLARNPNDPEILVVDPRTTETAMGATQHYAAAPQTDLDLFYGIGHLLIERDAVDHDFVTRHTAGFDAYAAHVKAFTPERVAASTGLSVAQLDRFAGTVAQGEAVSFWWTMGVNQSHQGVRTAQAIIDLALMTGNIGRPGTGANSVTGQCNAMGSRLFSNTTNLLGGHDFGDPEHRAKVAGALGIDAGAIPTDCGWAYDQILEGTASGAIRGLWVVATNGAHSWIGSTEFADRMERLDLLVVQDLYPDTETAAHADVVLPAAGWGEKDGTFINSERRIGLVKRVRRAPGQALADFWIFKLVAEAWGCGEQFRRWSDPEATFALLQQLSRGQPCDITGIDGYPDIDAAGGIQWPCPPGPTSVAAERRLFGDGHFFHPDGRARFLFDEPRPTTDTVRDRFPFVLMTGRGSVSQWHTQTRTGRSAMLRTLHPRQLYAEMARSDARRLGVAPEEEVIVESAIGRVAVRASVTTTVQPGHVFLPMHDPRTNRLTLPSFDPYSRQPAYKHTAVAVRKIEPWERGVD